MRIVTLGCEQVKVSHTMLGWALEKAGQLQVPFCNRGQSTGCLCACIWKADGRVPTQMGDGSRYSVQRPPFPRQLNGTPGYKKKAGKMVQKDFLDVVLLLTRCQRRCSPAALLHLAVPVLPYCGSTNLPAGRYLHSCIQLPKQPSGEILSLKTQPGG